MPSAYYRFFIGDYLRKTRGLSILQHGAYRLLIDEYMDNGGPLPNDFERLCNSLRAQSVEERAAVEFILGEFFVMKKTVFLHNRCDEELTHLRTRSEKARESVRLREIKRLSNDDRTITERSSIQNQNQNQRSSKALVVTSFQELEIVGANKEKPTGRRASRLPHDWAMSKDEIQFARESRPDLDPQALEAEFRDYWIAQPGTKGVKLDWAATWRNWVRRSNATAKQRQRVMVPSAADHAGLDRLGRELGVFPSQGDNYHTFREKIIEAMEK